MENAHAERAFAGADANAFLFLTVNHRNRISIATTIERLIDMLDALDMDPDLEDGGDDEPWLGWPNAGLQANADHVNDDRELDNADDEPWLGVTEQHPHSRVTLHFERTVIAGAVLYRDANGSQELWGEGDSDDREGDDERELDPAEDGIVEPAESDWPISWRPKGGVQIAEKLLHMAKPRRKASQTYGEFSHRLPDGSIMRTFVAADDARVLRLPTVKGGRL